MKSSTREITKTEALSMKDMDMGLRNKFRYEWLDLSVTIKTPNKGEVTVLVKDSIIKVNIAGRVYCKYCDDTIVYQSKGKTSIENHIKSLKHAVKVEDRLSHHTLDSSFTGPKKPAVFSIFNMKKKKTATTESGSCDNSVSVNPNPDSQPSTSVGPTSDDRCASAPSLAPPPPSMPHTPNPEPESDVKPLVSISDRTSNMEAMIVSFVAENNLSFNMVPNLVQLISSCASDPVALAKVKLNDVTCAYKLKYGVSEYFTQTLISNLQQAPFSLNIDEATAANNNKKVLSVLVSYFSSSEMKIVVEHFASLELVKTDSASIFDAVRRLIEDNDIPWTNLQSVLLDSCSVMRGSKSGFETRLRQLAPHLLDIDGDSCHHIHNTAKKFCEPFDNWIERLFNDIHTDFKWSSESKAFLMELCNIFDIKFTMPVRFVSHRWLSAYELALSTLRLYEIYRLYYSYDLSDTECKKGILQFISTLNNPTAELKVHEILTNLRQKEKNATKEGKERKARIKAKLFQNNNYTKMLLNLYSSVLGMMKTYVLKFQSKSPIIHLLHDEQMSVCKKLCASFIKAEALSDVPSKLKMLDVDDVEIHLPLKKCFIGKDTMKVLEVAPKSLQTEFLIKVNRAYRHSAKYLINIFPLTNPLLQQLAAIDPSIANHSAVTTSLIDLAKNFDHFLTPAEQNGVLIQIKDYTASTTGYNKGTDKIDVWWATKSEYPALQKLALTCLTIFHGPLVEGSFSSMKDIMKSKSACMQVSTLSALQSVKYALKSRNTSAVKLFSRKNIKHSPVDTFLVRSMKAAASKHKHYLDSLADKKLEQKKSYCQTARKQLQSKLQAKQLKEKAIRHQFKRHHKETELNSAKVERPCKPPPKKRQRL